MRQPVQDIVASRGWQGRAASEKLQAIGRLLWLWPAIMSAGMFGLVSVRADESSPSAPRVGEFANEQLQVDDSTRAYRLVVPNTVDLARPAPLVLAFHGWLVDNKDRMPRYSQLNATAEKYRFLLAYPNALDRTWGLTADRVERDLKFFDALVARLSTEYRVDAARVYAIGMSNGGYFAQLVGQHRSRIVAAVVSHSGPLATPVVGGAVAERKFPLLLAHGDQDRIVSVEQGRVARQWYERRDHEVEFVEMPGLGHRWGVAHGINERWWEFCAQRPLPTP